MQRERKKLLNYIDKKNPPDWWITNKTFSDVEKNKLTTAKNKFGITFSEELWKDLRTIQGINPWEEIMSIIDNEIKAHDNRQRKRKALKKD